MIEKGFHSGHRERMIEKFISLEGNVPDHELLEVLLYGLLPRIDTNRIAHKLLRMFGDIDGVFNAKSQDLIKVEGIGKQTATSIILTGKIIEKIAQKKKEKEEVSLYSLKEVKEESKKIFENIGNEKFVLFLLDENYKKKAFVTYKDEDYARVTADIPEIRNAFYIHKPKYALMVHNHPSGTLRPSEKDDFSTKKMSFLCAVNGVTFVDHVIIFEDGAYSYHNEHRMEVLLKEFDFDKIIEKL